MKKNYVLDTNILLESPTAIWGFEDNNVFITTTTLQELDDKKTAQGEVGFNARRVNHFIDDLCMKNKDHIKDGILLENGGKLAFLTEFDEFYLPEGYSLASPDNRIIAATKKLSVEDLLPTILVTNDVSMRTNALVCNVSVEAYKNDHLSSDDNFYKGHTTIEVPLDMIRKIDLITGTGFLDKNNFEEEFVENEFVTLIAKENPEIKKLCIYQDSTISEIPMGQTRAFGVVPRNDKQAYAMYALNAPASQIPLVILKAPAGAAKTFLSLACGLENTYDDKRKRLYNKVLITRNNVCTDADFGYLPGDLEEKMTPLLAPFYDNLETLLGMDGSDLMQEEISQQIEDMFMSGVIGVCPLAYMRGRSITNSYLIVDEAQNATKSQIRDIITRAGANTKIVLLGDPSQIDNHLLDKENNGLIFAANMMKGSPLCAQLTFDESDSVRSPLVKDALQRLVL